MRRLAAALIVAVVGVAVTSQPADGAIAPQDNNAKGGGLASAIRNTGLVIVPDEKNKGSVIDPNDRTRKR
jgi:hypothetical protein